jgi:uncharacterized protein (TIGR02118 family)
MLKFIIVVYKRPDISKEQFLIYFRDVHAPLAAKLPGLKKYAVNFPANDPKRKPPEWSAIVEFYWENKQAMEEAWDSPEGKAATNDLAECVDLERTTWSVVQETRIIG